MSSIDAAMDYVRTNEERYLAELKEFLSIPSISTLPENKQDVERAAKWLADQLEAIGMKRVQILATPGHPVVYAESLEAPGKPTILVYGHYDVQPVDPIDAWDTDPFEPTIRDDNIYARGASDMKSQIVAQLKAAEALATQGGLPVNFKYLLEGEEEMGSPNLVPFIEEHADLMKADVVLNCDTGILGPDLPAIVYALRGLAYFELEVHGPANDLHSGTFGGVVHNPAQVLCDLLSGMHDAQGRVTLPGFYDSVRSLDTEEREALAALNLSDVKWQALAKTPALWGEAGYTATERAGARPTLEVNGIYGGFTGEGSKTVIPAKAMAKISMRLVADQDEFAVREQLDAYLEAHAPDTVTWSVRQLAGGPGAIMDRNSRYMRTAVSALSEVFGKEPIFKREGGSVPIVGTLQRMLGIDSVMLGFGLPDDGIHGPNEKQHLPTFYRGIETYIRFMASL